LRHAREHLAAIGRCPALERLSALSLYWNHIGQKRAQEFFASPHLGRLAELDLNDNNILLGGLRALLSAHMPRLRSLNLRNNHLGDAGLRMLAAAPLVGQFRTLILPGNDVTDAGVLDLASSPHSANLEILDLSDSSALGDPTAQAIATSPSLRRLRHLNLDMPRNRRMRDAGIRALAESPNLSGVTTLGLAGCGVGAEGLEALAAASFLERLTSLSLAHNEQTPVSAWSRFFRCNRFPRLRQLDLSGCAIDERGAKALAAASSLAGLRELLLRGSCGARGVVALAASPHLANLTHLSLAGVEMGDEGALALARSPHLTRLRKLCATLSGDYPQREYIGITGRNALLERFGKDGVEFVWA
jgi:hypothetical protein